MFIFSIILTFFLMVILFALIYLIYREDYLNRFFEKIGWKEKKVKHNWAVFSWNSMLEKLNYKADIVFFGDSIIRGSNFHEEFSDKKIVNLGYSGDTLSGMLQRVSMIKAVNPKQVYVLAGINGLTIKNVETSVSTYKKLLNKIFEILPNSQVYVHSILPISAERETAAFNNDAIRSFNRQLADLTKEMGIEFIDIYPYYEKDGFLNSDMTTDGLHLQPYAYNGWAEILKKYITQDEFKIDKMTSGG